MKQIIRLAILGTACVLLAACGGGGGNSEPSFQVSLDRTSITFDYGQTSMPPAQIVSASWTGTPPPTLYVGATVEGTAIDPAIILTVSNTTARAQIYVAGGLAVGDYSGRVLFFVCSDSACANKIGGSPLPITYTVHVRAPIVTSTAPITLRDVRGSAPQTAAINTTATAGAWTASTSASWLTLSATSGSGASTLTIGYNIAGLTDGTYSGSVTVTGANNTTQTVPVSLIVSTPSFVFDLSTLNFTGVLGSPIASQNLNVALDAQSIFTWAVTSDVPWLTLDKTSGSSSDSIAVSFNLQNSPVSGTYQGHLQFTGLVDGQQLQKNVAVTLNLQHPTFVFTGSTVFSGVNGTVLPAHNFTVALSNGLAVPFTLQSNTNWILLGQTSTPDGNFTVGIDPAIGNLTSTLSTPNGNIHVSTVVAGETLSTDLTVYANLTRPSISISTPVVNFSFINGQTVTPQHVTLYVTPSVPTQLVFTHYPPWLKFTNTSSNGTISFDVTVDPTIGPLASDYRVSDYTVEAHVNGDVVPFVCSASINVGRPTLTASPTSVVLGGPNGRVADPVSVSLSLNPEISNAYAWTLSGVPTWLTANQTNGTVSGTPQQIILTPLPDQAPAGAQATVTLSADVNGDHVTTSVPLTLNVDSHRVYAARNGFAFVSTPSWIHLTDTVTIKNNYAQSGTWTAASDQTWLAVTSSGAMQGDLILSATAAGLATDHFYSAIVTVTPTDPRQGDPEHINVGLWVGSSTPTVDAPILKTGDFVYVTADPIRPYIYAHGVTGDIRVFNLYTGIEETAIATNVVTPAGMAVSSDGATLYIADTNDGSVIPIDLTDITNRVVGTRLYSLASRTSGALQYLRPSGTGVIAEDYWLFRTDTLATIPSTTTIASSATPSGDYTKLFTSGSRYDLDYMTANGGQLVIAASGQAFATIKPTDTASNFDGSRVCTTDSYATPFHCYNGLTLVDGPIIQLPGGGNYNVAMSVDGKTVIAVSSNYENPDLEVLDTTLTVTHSFEVGDTGAVTGGNGGSIISNSVVTSGDGFFVIAPVQFVDGGPGVRGARMTILPVGP